MFYVHEEFPDHAKFDAVRDSDPALFNELIGFWLVAGCDSRRRLEDGKTTLERLKRVTGLGDRCATLASKLVELKLWEKTRDGYLFHDWTHVQETKETVQRRRLKWKEAKRSQRSSSLDSPRESKSDSVGVSSPDSALDSQLESERVSMSESEVVSQTNRRGEDLPSEISDLSSSELSDPELRAVEFDSSHLTALFSRLRKGAGLAGYKLPMHEYSLAQDVIEWARSELPSDPGSACRQSIENYLRVEYFSTKGSPFGPWAKDPGSWLKTSETTRESGMLKRPTRVARPSTRDSFELSAAQLPDWLEEDAV